jgi:hypothetical protein
MEGEKMIEVTLTELGLFAWAVLATGQALKYHHERNVTAHMMREILENEGVRNEAIRKLKEWKATQSRA